MSVPFPKKLETIVINPREPVTAAVILMHGYGADQNDLAGLARTLALPGVRFVFPGAPLSLGHLGMPGGRAWAPIDIIAMQQAMMRGEHRDLSGAAPPEFYESLKLLHACVAEQNLPTHRIVVGGFSQGSMMATALALTLPAAPAGLVIWSGNLVDEAQLRAWAPTRAGLNFYQSHGTQDSVLGVAGARKLFALLQDNGLQGGFEEFRGGHEIPASVLASTSTFLRKQLS